MSKQYIMKIPYSTFKSSIFPNDLDVRKEVEEVAKDIIETNRKNFEKLYPNCDFDYDMQDNICIIYAYLKSK